LNFVADLTGYSPKERREIPVVINNFNRVTTLRDQIERVTDAGLHNIYVLDNGSTYPPLLDYYEHAPAQIVHLNRNIGYLALWESAFSLTLGDSPFIYSDSDVYPDDDCPSDFIDLFFETLIDYPQLDKVGLSLRLDDLPRSSPVTDAVLKHEAPLWQRRFSEKLYQAAVDTTFAFYRPGRCGGHWLNAGRTAAPYLARHAPWYFDPLDLSEEEIFYRSKVQTSTHWSSLVSPPDEPKASVGM
jgi:hypothetical protein